MKKLLLVTVAGLLSVSSFAQDMSLELSHSEMMSFEQSSALDELNPYDENIEAQLLEMDKAYELETGLSSHLDTSELKNKAETCKRNGCKVFLDVSVSTQIGSIYVDGVLKYSVKVSTGSRAHPTPTSGYLDNHPNGRVYDKYTSGKFPGGDYNGLGNMPYAVFIKGGFAVHGTGRSNWPKLGTRASHGCVRMHPDNARIFNRLVRSVGVAQSWIRVRP